MARQTKNPLWKENIWLVESGNIFTPALACPSRTKQNKTKQNKTGMEQVWCVIYVYVVTEGVCWVFICP